MEECLQRGKVGLRGTADVLIVQRRVDSDVCCEIEITNVALRGSRARRGYHEVAVSLQ